MPPRPTRRFEGVWKRRGFERIAGVDEVGRGCLAGPVVAAAVILGRRLPAGIDDSKRLSPDTRERLFAALECSSCQFAWGQAEAAEIDRVNIRQASFLAMKRAIAALPGKPDALLVDGFEIPDIGLPQRALIHGDARSLSIAAASIIAKVMRDRLMVALAQEYPDYGFERNVGYRPIHLEALRRVGPSRHHRRTFAPVRQAIEAELTLGLE